MKEHFLDLFTYNFNSNKVTIELLQQYGSKVPDKIFVTLSHILNAQHVWNCRILGIQEIFGVWLLHKLSEMDQINQDLFAQSRSILEEKDFSEVIAYKTSKGDSYTSKVQEILFHMINHSTYHRGQIMDQLRQVGLEAISTDYIFYKR
jgi:uncharacterized damage-inducible protein DinB